jgi:putative ABC transport system ATP-binding protein
MLALDRLHKTFNPGTQNAVAALRGVSLTIAEGSFVVVIGTNGSGKSTLLNAVAGSFFVDSGSLRLGERDITRWPEHRRAALIGRVFQNPFTGTAPQLSIAENLALADRRGRRRGLRLALNRATRAHLRDRVFQMGLGMEDRLDDAIGTLSGGQRQSLTLLMATLQRPDLLLLDEHTAALDPKSAEQVIRLTDEIVRREKLTTLMVTHSMHQAANLGDRLIMMVRGRVFHDFQGDEKRRLTPEALLRRFDEVRRREQLDESAAGQLQALYV